MSIHLFEKYWKIEPILPKIKNELVNSKLRKPAKNIMFGPDSIFNSRMNPATSPALLGSEIITGKQKKTERKEHVW